MAKKSTKIDVSQEVQDQVASLMEQKGDDVEKVRHLTAVMSKLTKSNELSVLTNSSEFNLLTRVAVAFVLFALKRHAARLGKPFSSSVQLAFVFTLGYLIGRYNHDVVKVEA